LAKKGAPVISPELEQTIGENYLTQIEFLVGLLEDQTSWQVLDIAGQRILNNLIDRLWSTPVLQEAVGQGSAPAIHILSTRLVNALTIPGNQIILTTGLLQQLDSLDELAGILAHEMAHIGNRDIAQQLIKSYIFQYLAEILSGGYSYLTSSTIQLVITMSWSRDAERAADLMAMEILRQAQISHLGLAGFFRKMSEDSFDNALIALVSSHPDSHGRAELFENIEAYPASPIYGQDSWRATALWPTYNHNKNIK